MEVPVVDLSFRVGGRGWRWRRLLVKFLFLLKDGYCWVILKDPIIQ